MECPKQITDSEKLNGRTIARVVFIDCQCFVFFQDDTFCIFYTDEDYPSLQLTDEIYDFTPERWNANDLVKLGFLTSDEESKIYEKDAVEREKRQRQNDIETLERLKKKYESQP